jgi:Abnormal spindle-like microcephaly-assoc'd, ASPM-SPD-2-Hydin
MMRLLTVLVLGFCLAACFSSTAPSTTPPPASSATVTFIPGESFSMNPTSVEFGNQMVNTTSAPRAVTVTNTGSTPQPVRGRMNGTPGQWQDFASTNDCPTMLAVGASCTLNITFTPSATGGRGAVLVVDGTNDEEGFVNVGGTGTLGVTGATTNL